VVAPQPKPDSIDLEHLEQTLRTNGYAMILARQKQMVEQAVGLLIGAADPPTMYRLQGSIDALRRAIAVPEILAAEIRVRESQKAQPRKQGRGRT